MNKKNIEVPGNILATQASVDRVMRRAGGALYKIENSSERLREEGISVESIRLKMPAEQDGEILLVITASTESGGIVAFHRQAGIAACLEGLSSRLDNGSLKWKEDEYARE